MENKKVKIIQPKREIELDTNGDAIVKRKRVCAYCRVSTDNDEQKTSYELQVKEYTQRIQSNPEWDFCGIYADEGISGTSTKNRKQFNEMIRKARCREIDIIITKSISRFTRNTVDCLNYIRELRNYNVEIFFEKENIYSSDSKVDFMLTILSSIAQEEARNTSENIKWTIQKRFKEGIPMINHNRFLGYTKDKKGGQLVIVEEEAKIVREIFALYVGGIGTSEICRICEKKGYLTGAGSPKWMISTIIGMLKNEKYCGNLLLQKTIGVDYLTHKRIKNQNIAPKYEIENSHEAIIDKETFMLAKRMMNERHEIRIGENKDTSKYNRKYAYSGIVTCNNCGMTMKRRQWNTGYASARIVLGCGDVHKGKTCSAKAIDLELIELATLEVVNEFFLKNENIFADIYKAVSSSLQFSESSEKIDKLNEEIQSLNGMIQELIDLKMEHGISREIFNAKYQNLDLSIKDKTAELKKLEKQQNIDYVKSQKIAQIKEFLNKESKEITELTFETLRAFIQKIFVINRENIVFCTATFKDINDKELIKNREKIVKSTPIATGKVYNKAQDKFVIYKVIAI